jgi:hypothetical protein
MKEKIVIKINPDDLDDISKGDELEFEKVIDDGKKKVTIVVKGQSNMLKHSCNGCHSNKTK